MKRTSILVLIGTLAVLLLVLAPMMVRAATSATASAAVPTRFLMAFSGRGALCRYYRG